MSTAYLALNALPLIARKCEDLVHLEGMSPHQVARRLALPLQVVAQHLLTARAARQAYAAMLGHRQPDDAPAPVAAPGQPSEAKRADEDRKLARELAGADEPDRVAVVQVCKPDKKAFAATRDEIIALAMEGIRPAEIARRLDRDVTEVYHTLTKARKRGIAIPPPPRGANQEMVVLAQQGVQVTEIASRLEVTRFVVQQALSVARRKGAVIPYDVRLPKIRKIPPSVILAQQGVQAADIAVRLGVGIQVVHVALSAARKRGLVVPYSVKKIRERRIADSTSGTSGTSGDIENPTMTAWLSRIAA
jgi:transposase